MDGSIVPDAPLDYVEFRILSSQKRYETCVWSRNKVEKVASGSLDQLSLHSSKVKVLYSEGSNVNFKIQPPDNIDNAEWFTKSIWTRFLHVVDSPEFLRLANAIKNEMSQLDDTRKFQLSLSAKAEDNASSDASKNELLRAMDLRLTALKGELVAALKQATGVTCSPTDIAKLEKVSHHFGADELRNCFRKFVELSSDSEAADLQSEKDFPSVTDSKDVKPGNHNPVPQPSHVDSPVKYGVSPAKVALVERQSSTDSEESLSSGDDQPSVERSRTLVRSASPRRSASPMRRVQIGRSGSRRAAALSIKSISYFPARERVSSHRDATGNSSEEDDSEQHPRKSESNVLRLSVQDKISLFENKQKDQTVDVHKTKPLLNSSAPANKAVLRRWSSGMGESSVQGLRDVTSETSAPISPLNKAAEFKQEADFDASGCQEVDDKIDSSERSENDVKVDNIESERQESSEQNASSDWSRQKEAGLNQLFMKMMESKSVVPRNKTNDNNKGKSSPDEQRGGFYDHYKKKRDEKLRGETNGKRAEKEAQLKVMQQALDERKAEIATTNTNDIDRRRSASKPAKPQKQSTQLANPKKELSKPAVLKKASSKQSPLPSTRKSWPSTPSPTVTGISPAKTASGPTSAGSTPTVRKPQAAKAVTRASMKVEKPQPQPKPLKSTQRDAKSSTGLDENKKQTVAKKGRTTKTKSQTLEEDQTPIPKPSFYSKVTKKSSVVPLETKPFLRKGSRNSPGVNPASTKTKDLSQPEDPSKNSGDVVQAEENNEAVINTPNVVTENEKDTETVENCDALGTAAQGLSPEKCEELENYNQVTTVGDDSSEIIDTPLINNETEEESGISPRAWVEIEEHQNEIVPCKDSPIQISSSPSNVPTIRVRHSLSQMLLEEISGEADNCEWGNAENPPAMVYQKDGPKGLKKLLNFARKSKAESHVTGLSSPSALSDGENDAEESTGGKRTADHLHRKSKQHAKNHGHSTISDATYENSDMSKFTSKNQEKLREGPVFTSTTTSKATRSFFSLSAFRGGKPNETRHSYH